MRISVGGKEVLAGIDTGASGLRLLPDAVQGAQVQAGDTPEVFSFASGARPAGVIGRAKVAIGALSGEGSVHLVTKVDCVPGRPQCPGRLGLGYGFLGNGLPGEGFRALLGGSMGPTTVDTPLKLVGARRWIIELPRPGETRPGRLVLNPTAAEVAEFRMVRLVGGFRRPRRRRPARLGAGVPAPGGGGRSVCGLTTLDTGAHFIRVLNAPPGTADFKSGEALVVDFLDPDRTPRAAPAGVGWEDPADRLWDRPGPPAGAAAGRRSLLRILGALRPGSAADRPEKPVRRRLGCLSPSPQRSDWGSPGNFRQAPPHPMPGITGKEPTC